MKTIVRGAISVVLALFLGVSISFMLSPDPTGITPILLGLVLTGVLIPACYFVLYRTVTDQQASS